MLDSTFLSLIGTIIFPGITGQFIAKDKFRVNSGEKPSPMISYLGNNFISWFLNKIEERIPKTILCFWNLINGSLDDWVVTELGGEEKAEVSLTEMFFLLEQQSTGNDGVLLTDGNKNIFHIRDFSGALRAVIVQWRQDGWHVHARTLERRIRWYDRNRIFSRKY